MANPDIKIYMDETHVYVELIDDDGNSFFSDYVYLNSDDRDERVLRFEVRGPMWLRGRMVPSYVILLPPILDSVRVELAHEIKYLPLRHGNFLCWQSVFVTVDGVETEITYTPHILANPLNQVENANSNLNSVLDVKDVQPPNAME